MRGGVAGIFIPLVAGQPFHARIPVHVTRVLPDGTTVEQKYYTLAARDGAGREYREGRDVVPSDSDREPPLMSTTVYDPKTSLRTNCNPVRRVCQQFTFDPTSHPVDEPVGPSSDGKSVLTREDLGKKTMDGVEVVGTRETRTFAPGAFGNDKPVVVTKEYWYSPQLQFDLSLTRIDPRNGTQKLEVTDLKLGEPGPEWFALPDGYRIVQERAVTGRSMYPAELEPLLEKQVGGMTPDQLTTALQPVEAALGAYARAHAAASPNDKNDTFAGQERLRLSSDLRMMQENHLPQAPQITEADLRLNQTLRAIMDSPCLNKPSPGDPPSMPTSADGLRAEQQAWVALRDAWIAFLAQLFPNADKTTFAWMITNERSSDLRRYQNVERNRGCIPEESIAPVLEGAVTGLTPDQLAAALKPVDAAINAYARAHAESAPNDKNPNFIRTVQMILNNELRMQAHSRMSTQDQFEEADLHLNQAYRAVVSSPCLAKSIPGDPPNAPVSEEKLRDEERAWVVMRDAWTKFMGTVFPTATNAGFGSMLTEMRANDLRQIQNIERNRGCTFSDQ
jgi:uncharacterized protein YecT (DUF1311 family)